MVQQAHHERTFSKFTSLLTSFRPILGSRISAPSISLPLQVGQGGLHSALAYQEPPRALASDSQLVAWL